MSHIAGHFKDGKPASHPHGHSHGHGRKPGYPKVFRWDPPAGHTVKGVEIVGSFTDWKKLPLIRAAVTGTWQITIPDIPGNRTHHYMLLADGQPVSDKNCDGLAKPESAQETQYQLTTPRGPRVLMLFAQTK